MSKFNMVSLAQHNALRLKHAEELLREFNKIAYSLNPKFPIPANSGRMAKLIALGEKSYSFIH